MTRCERNTCTYDAALLNGSVDDVVTGGGESVLVEVEYRRGDDVRVVDDDEGISELTGIDSDGAALLEVLHEAKM